MLIRHVNFLRLGSIFNQSQKAMEFRHYEQRPIQSAYKRSNTSLESKVRFQDEPNSSASKERLDDGCCLVERQAIFSSTAFYD